MRRLRFACRAARLQFKPHQIRIYGVNYNPVLYLVLYKNLFCIRGVVVESRDVVCFAYDDSTLDKSVRTAPR